MAQLSPMQEEVIAGVGGISLEQAAEALSAVMNRRIRAEAPRLEVCAPARIRESLPGTCLVAEVEHLSGLRGKSALLLGGEDAAVVAGLMLGREPSPGAPGEMELSALQEAVEQITAHMAAVLAEISGVEIRSSPPVLSVCPPGGGEPPCLEGDAPVVRLTHPLQVEGHGGMELIQIMPLELALELAALFPAGEQAPPQAEAPAGRAASEQAAAAESAAVRPPPLPAGAGPGPGDSWDKLDLVRDIPLEVTVILGKTRMPLGKLFALDRGSILPLEQAAGSAVEIRINKRAVARGEVVFVDGQFGVRITEHLAGP